MAKQNISAAVNAAVEPTVTALGYRLWDVRFEKEGADSYLRVLIEGDSPIGLIDCETVSRAVEPIIDALDPIDGSYYLQVSSAGLGRRLLREEHYDRCIGETVSALLIRPLPSGERTVRGTLVARDGSVITVEGDTAVRIDLKDVSYVKLCDDEDLFSNK